MIDRRVLIRKLASLDEQTRRLRKRMTATWDELKEDVDRQDAISLSLLVAVQDAMDIALHFASDEGWGVPDSYAEAFSLLVQHRIVDASLQGPLGGMAALRNRIAHGYASVDFQRVWQELPAGLKALDAFATQVSRHV